MLFLPFILCCPTQKDCMVCVCFLLEANCFCFWDSTIPKWSPSEITRRVSSELLPGVYTLGILVFGMCTWLGLANTSHAHVMQGHKASSSARRASFFLVTEGSPRVFSASGDVQSTSANLRSWKPQVGALDITLCFSFLGFAEEPQVKRPSSVKK